MTDTNEKQAEREAQEQAAKDAEKARLAAEQARANQTGKQPLDANGMPIHPLQAPPVEAVPFADLDARVGGERTVRGGVARLVSGIASRLKEIGSNQTADASQLRGEISQLADDIDRRADGFGEKIVAGTPSENERDPNAAAPVAPRLNV